MAMRLGALHLTFFRNYKKRTFSFDAPIVLFVGENTIGKTNILEAISVLSVGKSFRAQKDSDMVYWGNEVGRVRGEIVRVVDNTQDVLLLEIVLTTGSVGGRKTHVKKYLVNGVARRQVDFIGNFRSVLFSPTDLELVTDSPSVRREFLNGVLVQTDREYRRSMYSYERGLRQRNSLLDRIHEGSASPSQLLFWDHLLIKTGAYITQTRESFIDYINKTAKDDLSYKLVYDPSIISETRLAQYAQEEIAAKTTLIGPQRDDFRFEKLGRGSTSIDISRFGSRGEQRLAILWIKRAELAYIEKQTGERPVLLLDDIFSELDDKGKHIVLDTITKQQTIITSAEDDTQRLLEKTHEAQTIHLP